MKLKLGVIKETKNKTKIHWKFTKEDADKKNFLNIITTNNTSKLNCHNTSITIVLKNYIINIGS
jgi:hypothetical protein